ncbi:EAL domain-containing protein [Enterobacter roggenkampii]|nr:EAL domain-containing protein [Enterobacter roggenkampii]
MYLNINGRAINLFYTFENICDSNDKIVGFELLSSVKYRNYADKVYPEEYFNNINKADSSKILRSQFKAALQFLALNHKDSFVTINISEKVINYLAKDECLLRFLKENNNKIILEISEKVSSQSISELKLISKHAELWLDDFGKSNYREQASLLPFFSGVKLSHQFFLSIESLMCSGNLLRMLTQELRVNFNKLIVEGIESNESYNMAKTCGFDMYQGHHLGFHYIGMAE